MAVKNRKICPNCNSNQTKKVGIEDGVQRYKYKDCYKRFYSKRRPLRLQQVIVNKCIDKRQTLQDLSSETIKDCKYLLSELIDLCSTINSITINGKRGLYKAFKDYLLYKSIKKGTPRAFPTGIIQRYITKHKSNNLINYYNKSYLK